MLKAKSRLVSFRLSDEEYSEVRRLCDSEGNRSLSDFLRTVLCRLLRSGDTVSLYVHFDNLNSRMESLHAELKRLSASRQTDCPFLGPRSGEAPAVGREHPVDGSGAGSDICI
jgi:hypothetical protein